MKCIIFGSNPNTIALVFRFSFLFDVLFFVCMSICFLVEMDVFFFFFHSLFVAFASTLNRKYVCHHRTIVDSCLHCSQVFSLSRCVCVCVCTVSLCDNFPLWRRQQQWWLLFSVYVYFVYPSNWYSSNFQTTAKHHATKREKNKTKVIRYRHRNITQT